MQSKPLDEIIQDKQQSLKTYSEWSAESKPKQQQKILEQYTSISASFEKTKPPKILSEQFHKI